jgi:tRNA pseudouridine55 synthase
LDKIAGETSFKALFPLKRVFCTKRVGHAGTLDLRASGLIIAATGRATRLLPYVEAKDKCYTFRLHLGYETDTLEWDGEVVRTDERVETRDERGEVECHSEGVILSEAERSRRIQCGAPSVTREDLERVLPQFIGDIDQIPPKYCAVKIDGRRASDWMERGKQIELKPRRIHISSLKVIGEGFETEGASGKSFATFDLECNCSKGTYIRALGRDIARALGTCGCVSMIRRHRIGEVTVDRAVRGDALTPEHLLPVDQVLDFPVVRLNDDQLKAIRLGNWVPWHTPVENLSTTPGTEKFIFTADKNGTVIGLGVYDPGRICPKFFLGDD